MGEPYLPTTSLPEVAGKKVSFDEADALSDAANVFADFGVEFCLPWNGSADDRETELFNALVLACRAYSAAMSGE